MIADYYVVELRRLTGDRPRMYGLLDSSGKIIDISTVALTLGERFTSLREHKNYSVSYHAPVDLIVHDNVPYSVRDLPRNRQSTFKDGMLEILVRNA